MAVIVQVPFFVHIRLLVDEDPPEFGSNVSDIWRLTSQVLVYESDAVAMKVIGVPAGAVAVSGFNFMLVGVPGVTVNGDVSENPR